ncbi:MAG: dihydrolipoyl dehydrogenase [Candidatus Omnitrophica bacterium]|nr:dihydrolipoyl dehydrogenase [Candidatus Omnitrophota bacterium]
MALECDLAVIGSGPGGCAAALAGARRGLKVKIIEKAAWGGVCLNVGCIPTKAFLTVAAAIRRIRHAGQLGIRIGDCSIDFAAVCARTEKIVSTLSQGLTALLRREGIELVTGEAHFDSPHRLVIQHERNTDTLDARWIVIAAGARAVSGPWTLDEQRLLSYRGMLAQKQIPSSILVIGGGVIGCEFASLWSALGTSVTLVEQQPQLLPGEDADVVRWLTRHLQADGVNVLTGATVKDLTATAAGVKAVLSTGSLVSVDRCLVAIGQQPSIESLQLDRAGIQIGRGITVDAFCRTSQAHIAAIGDCIEGHGLAHWASAEGTRAVGNLLADPLESVDPLEVPHCVYTDPEIARVGLVQSQAAEPIKVSRFSFAALGKSHCDEETDGFVKVLVDPQTGQLRGAAIVGTQASSLIHHAALAIRHSLTARQLMRTITAHPTLSEGLTEAAAALYGESLCVASRSSMGSSATRSAS